MDTSKLQQKIQSGWTGILFSILVIVLGAIFQPIGATLTFLWRWLTKTPFPEIGFRKPNSWLKTILGGILIGITLKFLMLSIILPLFGAPSNGTYQFLYQNKVAAIQMFFVVLFFAGFSEEVIYRGFLFNRLEKLFGDITNRNLWIIILSSIIFGVLHFGQGIFGFINALLVSMVLGFLYYKTKKNIWFVMVIHTFFDWASILSIYTGWGKIVAKFFF